MTPETGAAVLALAVLRHPGHRPPPSQRLRRMRGFWCSAHLPLCGGDSLGRWVMPIRTGRSPHNAGRLHGRPEWINRRDAGRWRQ